MKYQQPLGAANQDESYVDGNDSTGTEGSPVPAAAIEHPQREIINVIKAAGLTPSKDDLGQLATAIQTIISSAKSTVELSSSLTSDLEQVAASSLAAKLLNDKINAINVVGLSSSLTSELEQVAASSLAAKLLNDKINKIDIIGAPLPWPVLQVPEGYLECRGQSFDPVVFPVLASLYPNNQLPDLRGEHIRGWDNGRGIDSGRVLLSAQGDQVKSHRHSISTNFGNNGSTRRIDRSNTSSAVTEYTSYSGGSENRVRTIAFMYITRAA